MSAVPVEVGWDADAAVAAWHGLPPLAGDVTTDACVVGLGATGLAAVQALVDRGLSVIGLDAGRVAAGAAGRNGGFLLGGPAPPLHQALAQWGDCAVDFYRETLRELDRVFELLGPDVVRRVGSIRLAGLPGAPDDAELADCAEHEAALRAHGIGVERYAGELGAGLFLPDDAAVNPAVRALALALPLTQVAALHERTPVTSVRAGTVDTPHGTVSAGVVIVAVDGRLEIVLPQLRGRVRTSRLQMLATEPVRPGRLPCPVYCRWGYDYAQQLPDGRMFVGGGRDLFVEDEWGTRTQPSAAVQHYLDGVAAQLAGEPVTVTHRWAASAAFTADSRALCTEVDPGVVAVGGYSGHGNLVGPVAARAAVALALDGTAPPAYFAG
ncbi:NAD(P)/FAD-dependent oxidoreductase [uncultured Jatrophihabitans sp.]|uniref:NAD(P)/FAD-dependent oxidoreductase n=1 Tax=uncultured Jatrophihabitans sp. TaxID=1610747 RepID=UPI0035CB14DE